jgi:TBC1 domain family member 5
MPLLRERRDAYTKSRDRLLQFIKHPEALNELSVDPLADDADVGFKSFTGTI